MSPQETSIPTAPPPAVEVQPPWSEGFGGAWPRSEWIEFDSVKTPEQLKADLRADLGPAWDIVTPGFKGWVLGPFVRIGWLPKWHHLSQRSHLAFRGGIAATPTGCRLTGYVRMHFLLELFLSLYYFATVGYGLMWLGSDWHPRYGRDFLFLLVMVSSITCLVRIGAKAAVREIHRHLEQVCLSAPEQESKEPGPLAPV